MDGAEGSNDDRREKLAELFARLASRDRSAPPPGAAPREPSEAEARRSNEVEPIEWLGADPASQILTLVLRQSRTPDPMTNECPPLPFDRACLDYKRTHGHYVGDGRPVRLLRFGFKPAGVAFDYPTLFEIVERRLVLPEITDDGIVVRDDFNLAGESYDYVVFFRPEDAHLAPRSPPPPGFIGEIL